MGDLDYGITPGHGWVASTTRSQTDEGLEKLKDQILGSAKEIVGRYKGLSLETSFTDYFPATMNTEPLTSLIKGTASPVMKI